MQSARTLYLLLFVALLLLDAMIYFFGLKLPPLPDLQQLQSTSGTVSRVNLGAFTGRGSKHSNFLTIHLQNHPEVFSLAYDDSLSDSNDAFKRVNKKLRPGDLIRIWVEPRPGFLLSDQGNAHFRILQMEHDGRLLVKHAEMVSAWEQENQWNLLLFVALNLVVLAGLGYLLVKNAADE